MKTAKELLQACLSQLGEYDVEAVVAETLPRSRPGHALASSQPGDDARHRSAS
jgi:hypothetical protein